MSASCPRCNQEQASVRYDFGREKILRCSDCSLLYLHPWPDLEELAQVYGDSYFENKDFLTGDNAQLFGYSDYIAERLTKQPQYADIAREIRALLPPSDHAPRLFEVGCGLGYFLNEGFEEGFDVSGIEFNEAAVERLRRKFAFPIFSGALETVELEPGSCDAAAMFDVIEHLRDPFTSLDQLYDALTPGGILAVSTVDAESFVSRLLGKRLEDFRRTREHLIFFGRETITDVLDEHGFDVVSIRSVGHTFELSFLLDRLALYNRPLFTALRRLVEKLGLGSIPLKINPFTKMLVLARRRAVRNPQPTPASAGPVAELDRVLVDELETLEKASPRHYRWVFDVIEPHLGRSILEVGSGTGVISKFLVPRCDSLILSDHDPIYLTKLDQRFGDLPHVQSRILDLNKFPYDRSEMDPDTIVCLNVLEHIEKSDDVLAGFADLLPQGGRLVLQVPNYPALYGSLDESYGHFRRYSSAQLREGLERAGFEVVFLRNFNPFSIPGWILTNNVLKSKRLNVGSLRIYEKLVPILRGFDFVSRIAGLSLIACGRKR